MYKERENDRFYERAATEFLRALRGDRSQIAFARRLGYRANPITDWENGRRAPTIREALRAALVTHLPVDEAFRQFAPLPTPDVSDLSSIALWLDGLRGSRSITELAEHTGASRYSIGRWLSGKSEPRVPDFMRLLDATTARLHDWVHFVVGVDRVPTLYGRFAQVEAARRLALERPWSEAVLRILETTSGRALGRNPAAQIADVLGIDEATVEDLLTELVAAGIVEKRRHRFDVLNNLNVDTASSSADLQRLRTHWARVGLDRLEEGHETDWFAYNVIAVSAEDSLRIEQRLRAAYREVRGIVADSKAPEVPAVLTMQLVRWTNTSHCRDEDSPS